MTIRASALVGTVLVAVLVAAGRGRRHTRRANGLGQAGGADHTQGTSGDCERIAARAGASRNACDAERTDVGEGHARRGEAVSEDSNVLAHAAGGH